MDADVLSALLRTTIAGGLAILLVLALRAPCRRRLGARAAYGLWIIPPVAAAASLLPGPAWTVPLMPAIPTGSPAPGASPVPAPASIPWLTIAWAAGVAASAALIAIRQHRFMAALGRKELDADGLPILRARDGFAAGPAVVGTLSPRIVLPADFETRYSAEERRMILAHERAHLFGHDPQANAVAALLQCLFWFNPLVHIAAHVFRVDQELNADADVIRQYPDRQRVYAEALLKTQIAARALILGCQWPAQSEHPLKQRIALLSQPPRAPALGAVAVMLAALVAGLSAWAATPRLTASPARTVVIWALLKSERTEPRAARRLVAAEGSWSDLSYQLPDGERYRVRLNPARLPDRIEVQVTVAHGGAVETLAPLKLYAAEPALIRSGKLTVVVTAGEKSD